MVDDSLGRVLIIEDDSSIARYLEMELCHEGYSVSVAHDGPTGLASTRESDYDVILLDLMLPGLDGLEVCRRIRRASDVPIIMITARDQTGDKIAGLDTGADDYLAKPFATEELLARIRALLRRSRKASAIAPAPANGVSEHRPRLAIADLVLDPSTREVRRGNRTVELTKREFDLLELLMRNPRVVLTREQILENVWGYDFPGQTNIVEVYIRYLRAKLDEPFPVRLIHTVRGVGYSLRHEP